jgi:hypothetical protein
MPEVDHILELLLRFLILHVTLYAKKLGLEESRCLELLPGPQIQQ